MINISHEIKKRRQEEIKEMIKKHKQFNKQNIRTGYVYLCRVCDTTQQKKTHNCFMDFLYI